jgi:hypothetical protein
MELESSDKNGKGRLMRPSGLGVTIAGIVWLSE